MGKEYKLCRVKTIQVTMSMIKDFDQHISVGLSVSLGDSLWSISMKLGVVNPAECYSCGWINQFIIMYRVFRGMMSPS